MESTPWKLFLVRHGEAEWNQANRYQGRSDLPITARGEAQARALANWFAESDVATIFTSPLVRARSTARMVAERLGLVAIVDDRLAELAYGQWEGLTQAEVKRRWPELLRLWKKAPDRVDFPGGECLRDVRRRIRNFLEDAVTHPGPVLAVTHQAIIRIAILEAQREPLSAYRQVRAETGSIAKLLRQGNRLVLDSLHEVGHWDSIGANPSPFR